MQINAIPVQVSTSNVHIMSLDFVFNNYKVCIHKHKHRLI